jgi:hypothetical protein
MDHTGIEENALRQRRLARINVRSNTDIAGLLERICAVRTIWVCGHSFCVSEKLESEMSKGTVCLSHLVGVIAGNYPQTE